MEAVPMATTLLEQLGGRDAVEMVVAAFYEKVLNDPLLQGYFRGVQLTRLYKNQTDFFCMALGQPEAYRGRDMRSVHAGMNIGDQEFDAVAVHLSNALAECGVGKAHIDTVIELIAPLRADVVTRQPEPKVDLRAEFFKPVQQAAACPMHAAKAAWRWVLPLVAVALIVAALVGILKYGV
jgi:hemoglobin